MKDLKILMTSAGSPAFLGAFRSLKMNGERNIEIIATDMRKEVYGAKIADKFYQVPPAGSEAYLNAINKIIRKEKIDFVMPLSTGEHLALSKDKSRIKAAVMTSNYDKLSLSLDKGKLYYLFRKIFHKRLKKLSHFKYFKISDPAFVDEKAKALGYPKKVICAKPAFGEGSRGFVIIDANANMPNQYFNSKSITSMTLEHFKSLLPQQWPMPEILIMEYVEGREFSVDLLLRDHKVIAGCVREREKVVSGISNIGKVVNEPKVFEVAKQIAELLKLEHNIGVQLIKDKKGKIFLMEVNPRLQGTTILCTAAGLNLPYLAVKSFRNEGAVVPKARVGVRMYRHLDEVWDGFVVPKRKPSIAIDFDGVISRYEMEWKGQEGFGITDARNYLVPLSKKYNIIIYTARRKLETVKAFLSSNKIPFNQLMKKPDAIAYVDDRAVEFINWKKAIKDIETLRGKHDGFFKRNKK